MLGVLVKAAGHYRAVPGNHRVVPETPAMIPVIAFEAHAAFGIPFITAVFSIGGDEPVGVVFKVVDLGRF